MRGMVQQPLIIYFYLRLYQLGGLIYYAGNQTFRPLGSNQQFYD